MFTKAAQISIFVKDQEEAKAVYTEKLGFVICDDVEFSPGWSYLTVSPSRNNETKMELVTADTPESIALIGKQAANHILAMFESDDIEKDYLEMKARGVKFHGEPKTVPGGIGVGFEDLYGNQLDLYQPSKSYD